MTPVSEPITIRQMIAALLYPADRRAWIGALVLGLLAIPSTVVLLWIWVRLGSVAPLRFEGPSLMVLEGDAVASQGGLQVRGTSPQGRVIVGVGLAGIDASRLGAVVFDAPGLQTATGAGLYWTARSNPSLGIPRELSLAEVVRGRADLSTDPRWTGNLESLGLIINGPLKGEITIRYLGLVPQRPGLTDVAAQLARNWVSPADWDGGAVNFYIGADRTERRYTRALSVLLWILSFAVLCRLAERLRVAQPPIEKTLLVALLVGWALLDLRWQTDLVHRYLAPSNDQLVEVDRRRAALWAQARKPLEREGTRVFLVSDDPSSFLTHRTRYHLGSVRTSMGMTRLPQRSERRAGDYLLVLGSREPLSYDAARGVLSGGGEAVPARLLFNSPVIGALFEVTGSGGGA